MSVLFASGVVSAYVVAVVGLHRLNMARMRRRAGGFPALARLDWGTLLEGLAPERLALDEIVRLPNGTPVPAAIRDATDPRTRMLRQIMVGPPAPLTDAECAEAGFLGGEARWLRILADARARPERALEQLAGARLDRPAEVYLREHLTLALRASVLNLEWVSFQVRRRLNDAIARFGEQPALYFARAQAAALVGLNGRAIDDLARAVYFSRQAPFYLAAALDTPYVAEARPPLAFQCRQALDARSAPRSNADPTG